MCFVTPFLYMKVDKFMPTKDTEYMESSALSRVEYVHHVILS